MSQISIVRCAEYEQDRVFAAVEQALRLIGGIEAFVRPGQKVLLKPNLLKPADPQDAVTTHPEFIRAVIRVVKTRTDRILIGDSPGGLVKAETVYERCGINRIAREENVATVRFDRVKTIDGIPFAAIKDEVDVIISLPKFKTHNLTTITNAVKNVFGLVPGLYKVHCHKQAPNAGVFSGVIAKIYGLVKPQLSIVDGILAMDGDGPSGGNPYQLGVVAAGSDAVALDAVFSKIIGIDPMSVGSTRQAHRLGLGRADAASITIAGESPESVKARGFQVPKVLMLYRLPNAVTRIIGRCIPLVMAVDRKKCTLCRMCMKLCPQQAIREVKGAISLDNRRCIACLCCSEMCPVDAIYLRFLRWRKKHEA
jgi:Uncharacterized conserved protein